MEIVRSGNKAEPNPFICGSLLNSTDLNCIGPCIYMKCFPLTEVHLIHAI